MDFLDGSLRKSPSDPKWAAGSAGSGKFRLIRVRVGPEAGSELDASVMASNAGKAPLEQRLATIELLTFDIDGTLTDATTWWAGEGIGWVQRYSVRDGEALLRMARSGLPVVPLSRNRTDVARIRMQHLRCTTDWLGVSDKLEALAQIRARFAVTDQAILHVGDGLDDAAIFEAVGVGVAVADAHADAIAAADLVLTARGGDRVIEVLEQHLRSAGNPRLARPAGEVHQ